MEGPAKYADNGGVKTPAAPFFLSLALFLLPSPETNAYFVRYKEQYFRLFHLHYIQYPDDTM
jgi:hypothetical protein